MNKNTYIAILYDRQSTLIAEHDFVRRLIRAKANPFPALTKRRAELEKELLELVDLIDSVINTPEPGE